MVKVLRCPACGALWRLDNTRHSELLRCSECKSVFAEDKAEQVVVDEEMLDTRLALVAKAEQQSREAEKTMSRLADELADFDGLDSEENDAQESVADTDPKEKPKSSFIWTLLAVVAVLVLLAGGFLAANKTVLSGAPQLRGLYENVCGKLPCPGFIWDQSSAFEITSALKISGDYDSEVERELKGLLPVVAATITNKSSHPQYLPILELKLFDAGNRTMAQRVLEPVEYGMEKGAALAPGESINVNLTISAPLPYEAKNAVVTAVSLLQ